MSAQLCRKCGLTPGPGGHAEDSHLCLTRQLALARQQLADQVMICDVERIAHAKETGELRAKLEAAQTMYREDTRHLRAQLDALRQEAGNLRP